MAYGDMDTFNTSYNLHPDFENVVLWYCATNRKFWSRIGHELENDLLDGPFAKDILQACREIAKDTNHGPDGILIVVEHLQSKVRAGKRHFFSDLAFRRHGYPGA